MSEKDVADKLAKLSTDVQAASLDHKLTPEQLRDVTIRLGTASAAYSGTKDKAAYCAEIDVIRKDNGL